MQTIQKYNEPTGVVEIAINPRFFPGELVINFANSFVDLDKFCHTTSNGSNHTGGPAYLGGGNAFAGFFTGFADDGIGHGLVTTQ